MMYAQEQTARSLDTTFQYGASLSQTARCCFKGAYQVATNSTVCALKCILHITLTVH